MDVNAELARLDAMHAQGQIAEAEYQAQRAALLAGYPPQPQAPYPGQPYPPQQGYPGQPYPGQPPYPGYPPQQPYPPQQKAGFQWPSIAGQPPERVKMIAIALACLIGAYILYSMMGKPTTPVTPNPVVNPGPIQPGPGPQQPVAGANPLLGTWTGINGNCVGARWVFTETGVTVYPVPGDTTHQPKVMDGLVYHVVDQNNVQVTVNGVTDTFTINNGVFVVESCSFQHQG